MSETPATSSFDDGLCRALRYYLALAAAIGTGRYFEAWLAAMQFRIALEAAERLVLEVAQALRADAAWRVAALRALATPMLQLAPAPTRREIHRLRSSDPHADRRAWDDAEQQWRRCVVMARVGEPEPIAPGRN